jgi:hypothetical protein
MIPKQARRLLDGEAYLRRAGAALVAGSCFNSTDWSIFFKTESGTFGENAQFGSSGPCGVDDGVFGACQSWPRSGEGGGITSGCAGGISRGSAGPPGGPLGSAGPPGGWTIGGITHCGDRGVKAG